MYLALARKYRPQKFEDLIGQPHITKTLQNAIALDKLYPALIFSGMKGVGKTSAARILSKTLNCEKGPATEPCNECATCIEITEDKSPDYIEIDGASNNGVEEVRSLKEKVKYKPFKNRFRIVVIDEVHMLSNSAWNALLKTIEEPPSHTYFIMATTDFHKIPATIVSRCQQFEFKRIPLEVIVKLLKEICSKENISISDYSLYIIARASEGGLRDAKKILDQAIALSQGDVKDKDVIDILGVIEEEIFISLTKAVFTKDRKSIIEQIHGLTERGMDLRFFYTEYLKFFRDLMILKSLDESEKLHNLNPENVPELKEMLKPVREVEILRYFNAAKDMEMAIKNTENPRIILEYLFLKLSYFPSLLSIEELLEKTQSGETSGAHFSRGDVPSARNEVSAIPSNNAGNRPAPPPPSQKASSPMDLFPETKPDVVGQMIETIKVENPRLAANMGSAVILLDGDNLSIKFPVSMELAYKNMGGQIDYIKDLAQRLLNRPVNIDLSLDHAGANEEDMRINELKNDEQINRLADSIKGQIISVKKISNDSNQ